MTQGPDLTEAHLSTRVVYPIWIHLRDLYGAEQADAVVVEAGLPPEHVKDTGRWVSVAFMHELERVIARRFYGLEEVPSPHHELWDLFRDSGRKSLSRETLGVLFHVIRLIASPSQLFARLGRHTHQATRVASFTVDQQTRGRVTVTCHVPKDMDSPGGCRSRLGYFESIPTLWGHPRAVVEHPVCQYDTASPADRCTYRITFVDRPVGALRATASAVAGATLGAAAGAALPDVGPMVAATVGGALGLGLAGWLSAFALARSARQDLANFTELVEAFDGRYRTLVESERRFNQLADNIHQAFWLATPARNRFVYVSPAFERVFGRSPEPLTECASRFWAAIHPEDRSRVATTLTRSPAPTDPLTYRVVWPDGAIRHVRERAFAVRDAGGQVRRVAGITEDVTDAVAAERTLAERDAELRQAQKLEAIGRLAGGIAHDFNNLLTVVLNGAELALEEIGDDHPSTTDLRDVLQAAKHAAQLTQQLLAYSRRQVLEMRPLQLEEVLSRTTVLLGRLLRDDIEVTLEVPPGGLWIRGDLPQLQQVILNLGINARDAMPRGGELVLRVDRRETTEPLVHRHGVVPPGRYASLTIRDTGVGMTPEELGHAFEPFFTGHPDEGGTGLGLATVQGIVAQHGGHVVCESARGIGTTFHVLLPEQDPPGVGAEAPEMRTPRTTARGLRAVILLVEDEPTLRRTCVRTLSSAGHEVIEAADAQAAVRLGRDLGRRLDLVITDVVMPGLSGRDLSVAIQAVRPELPILFTSGYTDDVVLRYGLERGAIDFLHKPFRPNDLLARVAEILDRPKGAPAQSVSLTG